MEPFVAELEGKVSGKKDFVIRILWLGRRRMDEKLGRTYDGSRSQDEQNREGVIAKLRHRGSDDLDACKAAGAKLVD